MEIHWAEWKRDAACHALDQKYGHHCIQNPTWKDVGVHGRLRWQLVSFATLNALLSAGGSIMKLLGCTSRSQRPGVRFNSVFAHSEISGCMGPRIFAWRGLP